MDFLNYVPPIDHIAKLCALRASGGQHHDAFIKVSLEVNPEGYEINPYLLDLLHTNTFTGNHTTEEPYTHVAYFDEVCSTFRMNAFVNEDLRLRFFSKTLEKDALNWYKNLPMDITGNWDKLFVAFVTYFILRIKLMGQDA